MIGHISKENLDGKVLNKLNDIKIENLKSDLNTEEDKLLFEKLAKNSITLIKNENQLLPIKDLTKKIAYLKMGDSNSDEFFKMLNHYNKVDNIKSDDYQIEKLIKILDPYD